MKKSLIIGVLSGALIVSLYFLVCMQYTSSKTKVDNNTKKQTVSVKKVKRETKKEESMSPAEKLINEYKDLVENGTFGEAEEFLENKIYTNPNLFTPEQQKEIDKLSAKNTEKYVANNKTALTQSEALDIVKNCDDVKFYNYGNMDNYYNLIDETYETTIAGGIEGYHIYLYYLTGYKDIFGEDGKEGIGTYFIDKNTGDIYKSIDSRYQLIVQGEDQ